jgi:hypothetical protein
MAELLLPPARVVPDRLTVSTPLDGDRFATPSTPVAVRLGSVFGDDRIAVVVALLKPCLADLVCLHFAIAPARALVSSSVWLAGSDPIPRKVALNW